MGASRQGQHPGICRDAAALIADYGGEGWFSVSSWDLSVAVSQVVLPCRGGHVWHMEDALESTHFAHALASLPTRSTGNVAIASLSRQGPSMYWKGWAELPGGSVALLCLHGDEYMCWEISTAGVARLLWDVRAAHIGVHEKVALIVSASGQADRAHLTEDGVLRLVEPHTGVETCSGDLFESSVIFRMCHLGQLGDDLVLVVAEVCTKMGQMALSVVLWSRSRTSIVARWTEKYDYAYDGQLYVLSRAGELRWLVCGFNDRGTRIVRRDVWTGGSLPEIRVSFTLCSNRVYVDQDASCMLALRWEDTTLIL